MRSNWKFSLVALLPMFLLRADIVVAQDSLNLRKVYEESYWGNASDVSRQGDYAYVATSSGIRVLNVVDSLAPAEVASLVLSDATDLFVRDEFAYVAANRSLEIVNIGSPLSPFIAGHYAPDENWRWNDYHAVTLVGEYACVVGRHLS